MTIYQVLIRDTGRFVENNAGDLLISIPHIKEAVENMESDKDIIYFGLRKLGVDHEAYIISRCTDAKQDYSFLSNYYRRVYAVIVEKSHKANTYITIAAKLLDITNEILASDIQNDAVKE